jgi:hypothetical protein
MITTTRLAKLLPWFFFTVGVALAFHYRMSNTSPGESGQAALSLLNTGVIGNPYILPTGPTAHVSPVLAWLLAAVYWAGGGNTPAARVGLGVIAALMYALSARVALRTCILAGNGKLAVWVATALMLVTPMPLFDSVVSYRQWDQPFAAYVLAQAWLLLESWRRSDRPGRQEISLAVLTGVGALVSPTTFPPLLLLLCGMLWWRRKADHWNARVFASGMVIAACLLPWGVRNQVELGKFIVSRSNFGLELATGNAPGAEGNSGSGSGVVLHPHDSAVAAREVQRLGEVGYMQKMTGLALGWIRADPWRFVVLTLMRIKLTFLPSLVMVGWYPALSATAAFGLFTLFGITKLAALASTLWFARRGVQVLLLPALLLTVLPLAPYFITHVNLRYLFPVYFSTIILIGLTASRLGGRVCTYRTPARAVSSLLR